jgi:hypothetical protein
MASCPQCDEGCCSSGEPTTIGKIGPKDIDCVEKREGEIRQLSLPRLKKTMARSRKRTCPRRGMAANCPQKHHLLISGSDVGFAALHNAQATGCLLQCHSIELRAGFTTDHSAQFACDLARKKTIEILQDVGNGV